MKRNDFNIWFVQEIASRWPKWKIGEHTLDDWFEAFGRSDPSRLTKAVKRLKIADDSFSPNTKRLLGILSSIPKPSKPAESKGSGITRQQYFEKLRTTGTKEERMSNMKSLKKGRHPNAESIDPEAYRWCQ